MPPRTTRRIRRRQLVTGGVGVAVALASILAVVAIVEGLPHAGRAKPAIGSSSSAPYESLPSTWPTIESGNPADAYVVPADATVVGTKHVLYSGTVEQASFSFVGYVVDDGGSGRGPCLDFTGRSTGSETGPSVSVCAYAPVVEPVPTGADLDLAGAGSSDIPDIEANFGFVSGRVADLRVELADGSTTQLPVFHAPEGWVGIRPFLFFPPGGQGGTVVALGADGTELGRAPMCVLDGASNSCHAPARQLVSIPTLTWPDVQPDADGVPYVDHEEGEQPVGDKIPVFHGEVTTPFTGGPVAFSLVVWQSGGGAITAGECVDLFEGYRASADPSYLGSDAVGGGSKSALSDLPAGALSKPVVLLVRSRAQGDHGETLLALAGLVTPDVVRLEMRAGGDVRDVPLIADPLSEAHRLFIAYPPLDPAGEPSGTLVALGADGSELWSGDVGSLVPPASGSDAGYSVTSQGGG
jgi:hypothetical protein